MGYNLKILIYMRFVLTAYFLDKSKQRSLKKISYNYVVIKYILEFEIFEQKMVSFVT